MKLTVEISKYPLAHGDYEQAINEFIDRIMAHTNLQVITNVTSTHIIGDYDYVMSALQTELKTSFEKYGSCVFVVKFIAGDLVAKHGSSVLRTSN